MSNITYATVSNQSRVEIPANKLIFMSKEAYDIVSAVRKQVVETISRVYNVNEIWNEFTLLSNLHGGDYHPLHADNEMLVDGEWHPNHTDYRSYSSILYLNTSGIDFQGGHINFPEIENIIPVEGLLVGFPSNRNFLHQTTPVTQGNRLSISLWMTGDKNHIEVF